MAEQNKRSYSKMKKIRKRYKKLFLGYDKEQQEEKELLSQKELELIETTINRIEAKINEMKDFSRTEKRKYAAEILKELVKLKDYRLTMEHLEKLNSLIDSEELERLSVSPIDTIDTNINAARRNVR